MTINSGEEPEFFCGGKLFAITQDDWTQFDTGPEYEINLVHVCHSVQLSVTFFGINRETTLAAASAEMYHLVLSHQTRCAVCQAHIVSGLLLPRLPKKEEE